MSKIDGGHAMIYSIRKDISATSKIMIDIARYKLSSKYKSVEWMRREKLNAFIFDYMNARNVEIDDTNDFVTLRDMVYQTMSNHWRVPDICLKCETAVIERTRFDRYGESTMCEDAEITEQNEKTIDEIFTVDYDGGKTNSEEAVLMVTDINRVPITILDELDESSPVESVLFDGNYVVAKTKSDTGTFESREIDLIPDNRKYEWRLSTRNKLLFLMEGTELKFLVMPVIFFE